MANPMVSRLGFLLLPLLQACNTCGVTHYEDGIVEIMLDLEGTNVVDDAFVEGGRLVHPINRELTASNVQGTWDWPASAGPSALRNLVVSVVWFDLGGPEERTDLTVFGGWSGAETSEPGALDASTEAVDVALESNRVGSASAELTLDGRKGFIEMRWAFEAASAERRTHPCDQRWE